MKLEPYFTRQNFDYVSPVPLYVQLYKLINSKIVERIWKPGDILPPERWICNELELSRTTVRQALNQLAQEGKIVRTKGKGTVVVKPKLRRSLNNLYNFSSEMMELGMTPHSKLVSFEVIKPPAFAAQQLEIEQKTKVYKICRLRYADNESLLLETAYIPVRLCPNLTAKELNDSLYAMIIEYTNALPAEASEVYEAIALTEKQANLLNTKPGMPSFRIQRTSKNTNGDIFEYSVILAPGNRNKYEITLKRNSIDYTRIV